jgi:hypothetical protein
MDIQDVWNWVIDEDALNVFFNNSPRFAPMSNDSTNIDLLHKSLVKKFFDYLKERNNVIIVSRPIFTLESTDKDSKPTSFTLGSMVREYPVDSFSVKNFSDTSDKFLKDMESYFKNQCVAVYGVSTILKMDKMDKIISFNLRCCKIPSNMMVVQEIVSRMVDRKITKLFK